MLDLEKITLNVREIALRAGAFLRNERSGFDRSKVEKKNAHDYVSYVDKESERRIVAQLRELLPEAGFIAEEGSLLIIDKIMSKIRFSIFGHDRLLHFFTRNDLY
jgi:myo-inositol-1(or 4)-monophosphatase